MNKTDLLLRMMEHPYEYTDNEWQQILLDEECRELYTLMARTHSALNAARADDQLTNESIDAEWQQFEELHSHDFNYSNRLSTKTLRNYIPLKIAVSFIGFLLITGIALAAFHFVQSTREAQPKTSETTSAINTTKEAPQAVVLSDSIKVDSIQTAPRVFDNITLEDMLDEIASAHHASVVFQNDDARQLRFHFMWKPDDTLDRIVEKLNTFESINIDVENDKLIVR